MSIFNSFPSVWQDYLSLNFNSDLYKLISGLTSTAYANDKVHPDKQNLFKALDLISPKQVKAIIIGQDPFHGPNQATGLAFSVLDNTPIPPSLRNIFKEVCTDIGSSKIIKSGSLESWAKQGVLLLNTTLSVKEGAPGSHVSFGWHNLTGAIISKLSDQEQNLVFVAWGNHAKEVVTSVNPKKHLILYAAHPSPLSASRGFFGCKHFSKTNSYLNSHNKVPIDWLSHLS